ncbi:MAG TPA: hypothetical protein VJK54_02545 [Chthoniobacterales bacterium]|nr:hypothetical protein [Chthoniobacterales bacterium]
MKLKLTLFTILLALLSFHTIFAQSNNNEAEGCRLKSEGQSSPIAEISHYI